MVAAATLAGATSFRSVADYIGDLPPEALERLGARRHPCTRRFVAPSESTIRRTVTSVDAAEADVLVGRWLAEQVRAGRLAARGVPTCTALALDGKTLKGSWAEVNTGSGKVRLFAALGHREGVVVGQRAIPADTNELTGGRPLLAAVAGHRTEDGNGDLTGTVITAAALPVHRGNIEALLDRGGEYVLRRAGQPADAGTRAGRVLPRRMRRRTTSPSTAATRPHRDPRDHHHQPRRRHRGVFQAVRIRRETCDLYDNPIRKPETVYGITSLTAQQANVR